MGVKVEKIELERVPNNVIKQKIEFEDDKLIQNGQACYCWSLWDKHVNAEVIYRNGWWMMVDGFSRTQIGL